MRRDRLPSVPVPELRPFRGAALRRVGRARPPAVLCPPYDVISRPSASGSWRATRATRSTSSCPTATTTAAATFDALDQATARCGATTGRSSTSTSSATRSADGSEHAARGFFCRLRLEPYGARQRRAAARAHHGGPKEDRFRLHVGASKANLSPVLLLYDDGAAGARAERCSMTLHRRAHRRRSTRSGPGGVGQPAVAGRSGESDAARELLGWPAARPLTIADGHHRYETALRYRERGRRRAVRLRAGAAVRGHSGGLAAAAWHRLISGVDGSAAARAAARLRTRSPARTARPTSPRRPSRAPDRSGCGRATAERSSSVDRRGRSSLPPGSVRDPALAGCLRAVEYALADDRHANRRAARPTGPAHVLADASAGDRRGRRGQADAAFLLRPTPIDDVLAVAAAGELMPAKSTFFHPKAATGLVFNR